MGLTLIPHPFRTVRDQRFDQGTLWSWVLCQAPLLAVLVLTGLVDPAAGFGRDAASAAQYAFSALLVQLGSMVLTVFKCFLCLWAGGVHGGITEAVKKLLPLLCLLALLEAAATAMLFLLHSLGLTAAYQICSQIQLFGQELLFASGAALWLYERENASLRRTLTTGLACFLLCSAWLLLPMFY